MIFRGFSLISALLLLVICQTARAEDWIRKLQTEAVEAGRSDFAHWGWEPDNYTLWGTHSNRLIPVYTCGTQGAGPGIDLQDYTEENSPYRQPAFVRKLYGRIPEGTVNPEADYCDQTNLYEIQLAALRAGKKHIFLVIFDGMDWQTTQAASIARQQSVDYREGRGTGLHFQDYMAGGNSQFAAMVTSPWADDLLVNVDTQTVEFKSPKMGGYSVAHGGQTPWSQAPDLKYPVGKSDDADFQHAYTDSSSSAGSMTAGIKTFNGGVNVDAEGLPVFTIAHVAQRRGLKIGAVTSVPISHATPAAAYAHNVSRDDFQDLTRDLLGLPSVSHPLSPMDGMDVVIGCGYGVVRNKDNGQGANFVPGNAYLTEADLQAIDARTVGRYVVAQRTEGVAGRELLQVAADDAIAQKKRLFGFFGTSYGHLPFQTADGDFLPTVGRTKKAEEYSQADLLENPTLADFTASAIQVLSQHPAGFWLMVEAGDVDWANHDNNIDNSIGAVLSGDDAVKVITDWVDQHSNWDESLMIVTADHGHYLVLRQPERLIAPVAQADE